MYWLLRSKKETLRKDIAFRSSRCQMFFKMGILKILQYSQENTSVGVVFFMKLQTWRSVTLLKRDSNTGVSSWIMRNFQGPLFPRKHPLVAASTLPQLSKENWWLLLIYHDQKEHFLNFFYLSTSFLLKFWLGAPGILSRAIITLR